MDYSIPRQQPAVVLRAHFNWLCALLAIALICVGGLTAAVGIVASGSADHAASASGARAAVKWQRRRSNPRPAPPQLQKSNYDEGARGPLPAQLAIARSTP